MQTDVNGCSTCPHGQEQFEEYWSALLKRHLVQYDYRTPDGRLFSTVANTLEIARHRRDSWLLEQAAGYFGEV